MWAVVCSNWSIWASFLSHFHSISTVWSHSFIFLLPWCCLSFVWWQVHVSFSAHLIHNKGKPLESYLIFLFLLLSSPPFMTASWVWFDVHWHFLEHTASTCVFMGLETCWICYLHWRQQSHRGYLLISTVDWPDSCLLSSMIGSQKTIFPYYMTIYYYYFMHNDHLIELGTYLTWLSKFSNVSWSLDKKSCWCWICCRFLTSLWHI